MNNTNQCPQALSFSHFPTEQPDLRSILSMENNTKTGGNTLRFLSQISRPSFSTVRKQNDALRNIKISSTKTKPNGSFLAWIIDDEHIPNLPLDYPLLKTHSLIHGISPPIIACRFSEVMRRLSISVRYDKKKATIYGETMDHITFKARLYNYVDQSEEVRGVIVEVQRLSGCAYSFSRIYRSIDRACNGVVIEHPKVLPKLIPLTQLDSSLEMKQHDVNAALNTVRVLLEKDDIETNLLGMEHLGTLTDVSKTAEDVANRVANAIFDDSNICDRVVMLVISNEKETKQGSEAILHRYALTVLLNALNVFASMGRLGDIVRKHGYMGSDLVSVLLGKVQQCEARPHDACLSIKCLVALMSVGELRRTVMSYDIQGIMKESHSIGECYNSSLMRESLVLLNALRLAA